MWVIIGLVIVALIVIISMGRWNKDVDNTNQTATTTTTNTQNTSATTNTSGSANNTAGQNTQNSTALSDSALSMIISNSLIRIPQTGIDAALSAGVADFKNGSAKGHVAMGNVIGKVQTENGYDVFVDMSVSTDKSPTVNHYVALFHNVDQKVTFTSAFQIGDRLTLIGVVASADKSVAMKPSQPFIMDSKLGYLITVTYLDRKNGEPFTTAPSVSKTVTIHVKNHILTS